MAVRGSTPEERRASRAKQTAQRRAATYQRELDGATTGVARVRTAMRYVLAVANDRPEADRGTIAADLLAVANKWNKEM